MQIFKNNKGIDESSQKFLRHKDDHALRMHNIASKLKNIAAASFIAIAIAAGPSSIPASISGGYNKGNSTAYSSNASALKIRNNPSSFSVSLSSNWSGYITESSFKHPLSVVSSIKGEWNVPEINYVKPKKKFIAITVNSMPFFFIIRPPSDVSEWIGVGGSKSSDNTLIQTGTDSTYSIRKNKFINQAWYELLPFQPVYIPRKEFTVKPGDEIYAEINLLSKSKNQWEIEIDNLTTNQNFKKIVTYKSSMTSGEWIVEDSTIAPRVILENGSSFYVPILCSLSYFKTIKFSSAIATVNSNTLPLGELKSKPDIMASWHWKNGKPNVLQIRAVPSKISYNGMGFDVRRINKAMSTNAIRNMKR